MKTIHLKCGHNIQVRGWPSKAGLAKVRHHYKKYHPTRMKKIIRKSLVTKRKRGLIKNRCKPNSVRFYHRKVKAKRPKKNPRQKPSLIYGDVKSIIASGNTTRGIKPTDVFEHKFGKGAKIFGMPDGTLRIVGKKKLWKK